MGCTSSKLDDLPAVALCRDRCSFLAAAIRHRYALADAHIAYLHSLSSVGSSLHSFFLSADAAPRDLSPPKIASEQAAPAAAAAARHSRSHSGSHLHFHDDDSEFDSDDNLSPSDSPLHHHHDHSGNHSPIHTYGHNITNYPNNETLGNYPIGEIGGYMNMNNNMMHMNYMKKEATPSILYEQIPYGTETIRMDMGESSSPVRGFMNMNNNMHINYMKNEAAPSILYEQRPYSAETIRMDMGESSSSSYYPYSNPYSSQNPNFNLYYGGNNNNGYGNGGNINNGYNNGFSGSGYGGGGPSYLAPMVNSEASSSKPPPPPSPPRGSPWDFLYPFENFENYYPPQTPSSRDSKEVREEEGIPDLEDEHEVVKEVYGNHKFSHGGGNKIYSKELHNDHEPNKIDENKVDPREIDTDMMYNSRSSAVAVESDPVEYEVHVVDKKVVGGGEREGNGGGSTAFKASGDSDVVREIQVQFLRASESGGELAKLLEVGKFPYKKSAAYQVSSKVLQVITPSLPRNSNEESSAISDPSYLDSNIVSEIRSGNLSSTLQKLYLWEKKLFEEVKIEEKMRILHERKVRKLKRLDERGAEAPKIDSTRDLVRSLSTKIRMAIQVVDKISVTINKLRDEELWPQLNEVVQGLTRMWKAMCECHHIQSQAIAQAKRLDAATMHKHFSDNQLEATRQLEHELLSWTLQFSCWINAQKGFVQSLNNWLMKCLLYVPEETSDGIVPFSPGRLGAPPIFVICNQWAQSIERISEKEVVDSMREFATSVLQLYERDSLELRQRMSANKDMERKVKILEREDQKIHKEIQALDKRIVLSSGTPSHNVVYQSETSKNGSLQSCMQHIFDAMEKFVSKSVKAYDDLLQRVEEDRRERVSKENERES